MLLLLVPYFLNLTRSHLLLQTLSNNVTSFSVQVHVETLTRKKLGKKSFIEKQERGRLRLQDIPTPTQIKELANKNELRKIGSSYYIKAWRHWRALAIESIRFELSQILPCPPDKEQFENLFFQLGVAADEGSMPSFEDEGARSGYALEFFCRGRNLADIFNIDTFNPICDFSNEWKHAIFDTPMLAGSGMIISTADPNRSESDMPYRISSLGGGPGFDFVGLALAAVFNSGGSKLTSPIHAKVFDFELGWRTLVDAMGTATINVLPLQDANDLSCTWGGKCDITKSMDHPHNDALRNDLVLTNLWTCQYCIAENVQLLRQSNYIFFRDLFDLAPEGTLFILTETTPRVWPDLCNVIEQYCGEYMEVGFNRNGRQLLLRKISTNDRGLKRKSIMMNDYHSDQLNEYMEMDECHNKKINSGYQRHGPKKRGLKV